MAIHCFDQFQRGCRGRIASKTEESWIEGNVDDSRIEHRSSDEFPHHLEEMKKLLASLGLRLIIAHWGREQAQLAKGVFGSFFRLIFAPQLKLLF